MARAAPSHELRRRLIADAVTVLAQARAELGISPTFVLGEGNLLF